MARAALGLLLLFLLSGCSDDPAALKLAGSTMGTSYHITVTDPTGQLDAETLRAAVDQRLLSLNQALSTYIEDSELNRLNRSPIGVWQTVGEDLYQVLLSSMQISWLSAGAFDVTVSPLVKLWGFGPGPHTGTVPEAEAIATALRQVGFQNIEVDIVERRVRRTADVDIDLSAIAKGYAVDVIAALVGGQGVSDFLVEIGGELYGVGQNPRGEPWRVAIERPAAGDGDGALHVAMQPLRISGVGVATSGDYRNYFEQDGVRYAHTIDPTTGRPVTHGLASVSVIAESAMEADGLATALSVLGPERGYKLAEQQDLAVFLVIKRAGEQGFDIRYTPPFAQYLDDPGASL